MLLQTILCGLTRPMHFQRALSFNSFFYPDRILNGVWCVPPVRLFINILTQRFFIKEFVKKIKYFKSLVKKIKKVVVLFVLKEIYCLYGHFR